MADVTRSYVLLIFKLILWIIINKIFIWIIQNNLANHLGIKRFEKYMFYCVKHLVGIHWVQCHSSPNDSCWGHGEILSQIYLTQHSGKRSRTDHSKYAKINAESGRQNVDYIGQRSLDLYTKKQHWCKWLQNIFLKVWIVLPACLLD